MPVKPFLLLMILLYACQKKGGSSTPETSSQVQADSTGEVAPKNDSDNDSKNLTGESLYAKKCQSCHNPSATSSKRNLTKDRLEKALSGEAAMQGLPDLSEEQKNSLIALLKDASVPETGDSGATYDTGAESREVSEKKKGTELYGTHCSRCHLKIEESTKLGSDYEVIQYAIENNSTMKPLQDLQALKKDQVQAIAAALAPSSEPTTSGSSDPGDQGTGSVENSAGKAPFSVSDGKVLYKNMCSSCHGSLDGTDKKNRSVKQIKEAIDLVPKMQEMMGIRKLTVNEVTSVALALSDNPVNVSTPVDDDEWVVKEDGLSLYNSNCSGCHNSLALTTKKGRSAKNISLASDWLEEMEDTAGLTDDQINKIADALNTQVPEENHENISYHEYLEPIRKKADREVFCARKTDNVVDNAFCNGIVPELDQVKSLSDLQTALGISPKTE